MALSPTDRSRIRFYMGWTQRYLQTDSRLEFAMNAADEDANTLLLIQDTLQNGGLLASLADIDSRITGAYLRIQVAEVGTIKLPGALEISILRAEGRRIAGRLASTLGCPVRHDVFSARGPEDYMGYGGPYGGGGGNSGNLPRLG